MSRMPGRWVGYVLGGLLLTVTASCGADEPVVRPLVSIPEDRLALAKYDDKSVQERLDRLVEELAQAAKTSGSWGKLTTDDVNPLLPDLTFVSSSRATSAYGSGTESASMFSTDNYSIFAMAADETGNCWALRISDPSTYAGGGDPVVLRTTIFSPQCRAEVHQDRPPGEWGAQWPQAAEPTETLP